MSTVILATGTIAKADTLAVELHESLEAPPVVLLRWPQAPSVCEPHRLPAVANEILAVMGAAIGRLAARDT